MSDIKMTEIQRPIRSNRVSNSQDDERLRQRLSQIETPFLNHKENSWPKKTITGFVILIIIIAAIIGSFLLFSKKDNQDKNNQKQWQAIFLTNNEVYFGQIISQNNQKVILRNVYYPQNTASLQQGKLNEQTSEIQLIKLGNEPHGPTDEMQINYQHILYIENLTDDSKVVRAIRNYEEVK